MFRLYNVVKLIKYSFLTSKILQLHLKLNKFLNVHPGQYLMLWVPRVGEIPLAVADYDNHNLMLIIAKKGKVTSYIHDNIGSFNYFHIRGPYGRGYNYSGLKKALIIGGGYGVASLLYLAKKMFEKKIKIFTFVGFRTKKDIILMEYFKRYSSLIYVATDDGSLGFKGTVLDLLKAKFDEVKPDKVFVCGPERMEYRVLHYLYNKGIEAEMSLERLIKCAIGLCGSCVLQPLGLLVCKDGPVFSSDVLIKVKDFGRVWHSSSGKEVTLNES